MPERRGTLKFPLRLQSRPGSWRMVRGRAFRARVATHVSTPGVAAGRQTVVARPSVSSGSLESHRTWTPATEEARRLQGPGRETRLGQ